ncbi:MAG: ribokinase [Candidatus Onthovivens sp.]|nr:ribokinase [Candidatus Onthovivens sp.]
MKVLVVGSSNVDITLRVDKFLAPGETCAAISKSIALGGKGLNQAIALKRSGADVTFVTCLGDDDLGKMIEKTIQENKLDSIIIKKDNSSSGQAYILVDSKGENEIIIDHESNYMFGKEDLIKYEEKFACYDILLLQNEIKEEVNEYLINKFYDLGKIIVYNNAPFRKISDNTLSKIDYLIVNETELEQMVGSDNERSNFLLDKVLSKGVKNVILTLGDKGSIFKSKKEEIHMPAKHVHAIDTVGAGDTFVGYFVSFIKDLNVAISLATIASAISVTRRGAIPSIPSCSEVENFDLN